MEERDIMQKGLEKILKEFGFLWAIRSRWDRITVRVGRAPRKHADFVKAVEESHEHYLVLESKDRGWMVVRVEVSDERLLLCQGEKVHDSYFEGRFSLRYFVTVFDHHKAKFTQVIDPELQPRADITVWRQPVGVSWDTLFGV